MAAVPFQGALRLALHTFHHKVIDTVLVTDVMQRTDVRVIQAGDSLRFALEPLLRMGSEENCAGKILIATVRSNRVSRARYTSPIPPAPRGDRIS